MIKINLLPKTINQKVILRNTAIAFAIGLVAVIAGGVVYTMILKGQVTQKEEEAATIEAQKARVEALQSQTSQVNSRVAPLLARLDFVQQVLNYNNRYPQLFADVARWTYRNVQYTTLACDGTQVFMNATVKNLDDLGRYMMNMYRATDLFTQVNISGVSGDGLAQTGAGGYPMPGGMPGGPMYTPAMPSGPGGMAGIGAISAGVERTPGQQDWITFSVSATLLNPIVAPAFNGVGWTADTGQGGMQGPPMGPSMGRPMAPMPGRPGGP